MSICIKDQIQNMNLVIGCTVGCAYCYARNNVKRWHMIDDFTDPEFFPGKLKMMEKKRPQNFLLTGMSDLSGWKPEWRDEILYVLLCEMGLLLTVLLELDSLVVLFLCLLKNKNDTVYSSLKNSGI